MYNFSSMDENDFSGFYMHNNPASRQHFLDKFLTKIKPDKDDSDDLSYVAAMKLTRLINDQYKNINNSTDDFKFTITDTWIVTFAVEEIKLNILE